MFPAQFLNSLTVRTHQEYFSISPMKQCHGVIEPDPFHVQSHSSLIPCDQGSLTAYTSFWAPSQPVGYNEFIKKGF